MLHRLYEADSLLQPNGQVPPLRPLHMVQASAPGKCILFGEHAVVYGQPAVAVAIDQRMNVGIEISEEWRIDGMRFHPERHPHVEALANVLEYIKAAEVLYKIDQRYRFVVA